MKKKVAFREGRQHQPPAGPMKRLTLDVPLELHRRIKVACATRGLKMADVLRALLERQFPPKP